MKLSYWFLLVVVPLCGCKGLSETVSSFTAPGVNDSLATLSSEVAAIAADTEDAGGALGAAGYTGSGAGLAALLLVLKRRFLDKEA